MSEAAIIPRAAANGNSGLAGAVLIIDDEAEIRESLQTLLELEGFAVETAASGEAGLQRIGEHPFDLILLDLTLPGRNGMDSSSRDSCSRNRTARHHDHRVWHGGKCSSRDAGWSGKFCPEAVGQRKTLWPTSARQWDGAAPRKKTYN